MTVASEKSFYVCYLCSEAVAIDHAHSTVVVCHRCGHKNHRGKEKSSVLTFIFSLTALIFYVPANVLPFMSIELYGNRSSSTIWSGIVSLTESGSWAIAFVVLLASMIIPFVKLIILFYLSATATNGKHALRKTKLYHFVESIGRWSMLDIFLLAVLVAIMKLGPWTRVEPEMGSVMFLLVVIFTMLASANFDPRIFWKETKDYDYNKQMGLF